MTRAIKDGPWTVRLLIVVVMSIECGDNQSEEGQGKRGKGEGIRRGDKKRGNRRGPH